MRADPKKVRAVEEWARPTDRTQLRRFLGFANFYQRFIRSFSRVAAPLTALTSTLRPFSWTPEAERAFSALKSLFTSTPVLMLPQPSRQFIVEVDASDVSIGAVLSPAVGGGPADPPGCLPVPSLHSCRGQLRHRQPRTLGRTCRPDGVAALAGGGPTSHTHLD